jgi:phage shock protein PspC (stress-responsive transcriptional regulator)
MICGVAIGLAERYGVRVSLVRAVFVTAFIAAPITVFLYLLFSLSTPSEISVAGKLRLLPIEQIRSPRERFEQTSYVLSERLLEIRTSQWLPAHTLPIWLLVFAAILEFPRIENIAPTLSHPMLASFLNGASLWGTPLFYISMTLLFLFQKEHPDPTPAFIIPHQYRFSVNRGDKKIIGGVISGLSRILGIDPAYLRMLFIIVNIFTMGLAGAVYLLVWYLHRESENIVVVSDREDPSIPHVAPKRSFRISLAMLFILLASIHVLNAYRIFFFNESLFQGAAMALVGMVLVWHGIGTFRTRDPLWLLGGASIFFIGVYLCVMNVAHLQIPLAKDLEVVEIILALTMVYLGFIAFRGYARSVAFVIASVFALSSLLIAAGFIPTIYLMELVRFYGFFYPLIFGGLGLWIAFEK